MIKRVSQLVLVAILVLSQADPAPAQARARKTKPGGKPVKTTSIIYKMFPDYDTFQLGWEQYRRQRATDLLEVNSILYDLSKEERERVESLMQKYEQAPESKEKRRNENAKLNDLINERAEIVKSLQSTFDAEKADSREAQHAISNSGLMKTQAQIASLEAGENDVVNQIRPAIEAMIGPERTQTAYSQWRYRIEQARERVEMKSIVSTVRQPREVRDARLNARRSAPPAEKEPGRMRSVPRNPGKTVAPPVRKPPVRKPPRRTPRRTRPDVDKKDAAADKAPPPRRTPRSRSNSARPAKPVPLDEWEQYVHDFLKSYECTPEQTHSAIAILSELKDRAEQHKGASRKQLEAAEAIKDRRERQKRIDAINAPVHRLFDQLKRRLDGLLTTHQRALKKAADAKGSTKTRKRH